MVPLEPLDPDLLYRRCDPSKLDFASTEELAPLEETLGQPRAVAAIEFGIGVDGDGFNIFAFGAPGTGKHTVLEQFLAQRAAKMPAPFEWCYVNNFDEPVKPRLLRLPAGLGSKLARDMDGLVEALVTSLSAAIESEDYQTRRQALEEEFDEKPGA
ncbi:MAG: AAA family ATPase, partial [Acidobacteriota bacterium]